MDSKESQVAKFDSESQIAPIPHVSESIWILQVVLKGYGGARLHIAFMIPVESTDPSEMLVELSKGANVFYHAFPLRCIICGRAATRTFGSPKHKVFYRRYVESCDKRSVVLQRNRLIDAMCVYAKPHVPGLPTPIFYEVPKEGTASVPRPAKEEDPNGPLQVFRASSEELGEVFYALSTPLMESIALCTYNSKSKCAKEACVRFPDVLPSADLVVEARNPPVVIGSCTQCGKSEPQVQMYRCADCHLMCYCSRACQRKDWADHKERCSTMVGACLFDESGESFVWKGKKEWFGL